MADLNMSEKVEWPARAVVTPGLPEAKKPQNKRPHSRG